MSKHISLPRSRMWRTRAATALAAAGALVMSGGLVMLAAPAASANGAPGNDGTLKILDATSGEEFIDNEPKVCSFKYEGFYFDDGQSGDVIVTGQGLTDFGPENAGSVTANSEGYFITPVQVLASGHYKVEFQSGEDSSKFKSKVFKVNCTPEVSPVTPTVTPSRCVEGQPTKATLNLPADTDEIDYEYGAGNTTVVATLKKPATNDWGTLPTGWSLSGSTATYTPPAGSFDDATCGDGKTDVSPATPTVTRSVCVEGQPTKATLNLPADTDEIDYEYGAGNTTVVATLKKPATNDWGTLPTGWSLSGSTATYAPPAGSFDDATCGDGKTDVSPVTPTVTPSRCVGTNPTAAVINKPADGSSIAYALNGTTVTATLTDTVSHQWGSMPSGWVKVDGDTATYTVPASALAPADCTPPPPPTDVCPNIPGLQASVPAGYQLIDGDCVQILGVEKIAPTVSFADPTCERLNRAKWSGNLTDLVDYTVSGTPGRGNSVTVTANIKPAVADQFAFADGFVNTFDHSYPSKADLKCATVKGSESSRPKPHTTRTPTVLGTQAVAPTAVDAGLASLPGDSATSTASLLAQLMVAGGLLLLLAGGWLGLGRRENGAHQA